jgi:hypothetical protein
MKRLIKKILNERLGVPEGILESSEMLYDLILDSVKGLGNPPKESTSLTFHTNLKIIDLVFKTVNVDVEFIETDELDRVELLSMGFRNQNSFSDESLVLVNIISHGEVSFSITIAGPEGTTMEDIVNLFESKKNDMISSLAHELSHSVEFFKQKKVGVKKLSSYAGYQKTRFPFRPIQKFLHYLYFVHSIENIVRPSEVSSLMRSGNIDREKFYEFLLNTRVYVMLKEINNFSFQTMREELKNDYVNISHFLKKIGVDVSNIKTKDEIVDKLLEIVYINLINNSLSEVKKMMTNNFLEELFGFKTGSDKDKLFENLIKFFTRFEKNPNGFYTFEEKNFKIISNKMMKKLSKLYDMANIDYSSIKNWDLHHKINKTGEQFETEIKFKRK